MPALDRAFKGLYDFDLMADVFDATRSILLNPWYVARFGGRCIEHGHIGWRWLGGGCH